MGNQQISSTTVQNLWKESDQKAISEQEAEQLLSTLVQKENLKVSEQTIGETIRKCRQGSEEEVVFNLQKFKHLVAELVLTSEGKLSESLLLSLQQIVCIVVGDKETEKRDLIREFIRGICRQEWEYDVNSHTVTLQVSQIESEYQKMVSARKVLVGPTSRGSRNSRGDKRSDEKEGGREKEEKEKEKEKEKENEEKEKEKEKEKEHEKEREKEDEVLGKEEEKPLEKKDDSSESSEESTRESSRIKKIGMKAAPPFIFKREKEKFHLTVCDTTNTDGHSRLRHLEYSITHSHATPSDTIVLITYSVIHPQTFENVKAEWVKEIRSHFKEEIPFLLVGTHVDLREQVLAGRLRVGEEEEFRWSEDGRGPKNCERLEEEEGKKLVVSTEEGIQMANELGALGLVECSVSTREGIKELFITAAHMVLENRKVITY